MGFSFINHPFWGSTIYGHPQISLEIFVKHISNGSACVTPQAQKTAKALVNRGLHLSNYFQIAQTSELAIVWCPQR